MPRVKKLISDEKKAVSDYGKSAKKAVAAGDPQAAKTFTHIQGEEKEHARELKALHMRKRDTTRTRF
jgi:rubrerythrin